MSQVMQLGDAGPLFELHHPHTVESLKADLAHATATTPRSWRCRRGWHRFEVVGDIYTPSAGASLQELVASVTALMASAHVAALVRCERCHLVTRELRP